jgi:hypothetical protein
MAVLSTAVLTTAALVIVSSRGNDHPTLKVFIDPRDGANEGVPEGFNEFATSLYERQRAYCQQPWSALLVEAGEPSRPFSRSALSDTAAKLPLLKTFTDELLTNIATDGCVAGFLELLERDPTYALS